ncbi:hypothetical protein [Mycolicibacterium sp. HK-90]|uniref:hypothetical protein n=1 Tax=Mycolicibacterium sp. HK-90 TaxID=3056937 RepID=UPI002658E98B|nr:hypothetical protein [Mycolicibacterium sp. HK-90]WKG02419.1 hypothetical protein QU592_24895 [Mycolicibacterium sp. HK-90]
MAVRPLVITGAALLSAGALIAATPALFVPRSEITVAATAPGPTKLTQEQIDLLALSLQGAWQSFTQGYGGIWFPGEDPDTGDPVAGDCTLDGAVCLDGFPGLAYYLSDNILPLGDLDNIFFEGGFTELAHQAVRTVAVAIDAVDPTGRLDLTRRVDDFFEGGATQLVGNLLLDNLPQDGYAYGLTNSFFFGYGANTGITAAITYIVDAIAQGTPTPEPNLINPLDSGPGLFSTEEEGDSDTALLAKKETGVASTSLPEPGSLLKLPTPTFESPLKDLKLPFKAPTVEEPTVVEEVDGTENLVEGGAGALPVGIELPTPEAPKFEIPEAPEFKLPEFKAPELKVDILPKVPTKTTKAEEGAEDAETGVDTKTGNKVTPPVLFGDGGPKGETNGSKFLKKLDKAFRDATGAGDDSGADSDSGDSGDK